VTDIYGTDTAEYNNALGFFVLMWAVLNFFLFGSLPISVNIHLLPQSPTDSFRNLVYIGTFFFVELPSALVAASYFAVADGKPDTSTALKKAEGVFAFLAGLLDVTQLAI